MKPMLRALLVALLASALVPLVVLPQSGEGLVTPRAAVSEADARRLAQLETLIDGLRQELKIPALSAAVVRDQKVIWARGFGLADVENNIPATEHTTYHLASLTKTFASTVVMRLVEEGKVSLDDPVSKYGIELKSEGVVRVRHLLSHTSEGSPGERYRYNGSRFGELDKVIEKTTGKSFAELLAADILDPLGMDETAPNVAPDAKLDPADARRRRFDAVSKKLARPYGLDGEFNVKRIEYPTAFATSAGLISSVLDVAKYDIAVDQNRFLKRDTQQLAFTPARSNKGATLPYGLGWFTQDFRGTRLIWHYGYWTGNSSLILKLPERNLTFIALANTDNLSRPTDLGNGDVLSSPVGMAFLKTFLFPETFGESLPEIDWKSADAALQEQLRRTAGKPYADVVNRELLTRARMSVSVGRPGEAARLFRVYQTLNARSLPAALSGRRVIARVERVGDEQSQTAEFTLPREQGARVFALGEGKDGQMFDYGWIENAETKQIVWEMKEPQTTHAGGAAINRLIDTSVRLPAGKYKLRFKSDDSHSFDRWVTLPPHINFWGIALYADEE